MFSYLYQSRSVGMLHALPVKREGLFLTNYLSGLSFLLLAAPSQSSGLPAGRAAKGCLNAEPWAVLGCQVCYALFFYSFASSAPCSPGHILALPAFYAILNGLATGLYVLVSAVLRQFVFGFSGIDGGAGSLVGWTPVAKLIDKVGAFREWDEAQAVVLAIRFRGSANALVYALAGLCWRSCPVPLPPPFAGDRRRRGGEVSWVRPTSSYGRGPVRRPGLRLVLYAWLGWNLPQGAWTLAAVSCSFAAPWATFVAEMLLQKAFWVL